MFARVAIELLRVLILIAVVRLGIIFFLRVDELTANLDRSQFVFSNPAIQNLLFPGRGIEIP